MAQLSTVLDNTYLETLRGGAGYRTTIYDSAAGFESRNKVWATPRRSYDLTFIGLDTEVQSVVDLFDEAFGREKSFLWTPPGGVQSSYRFGTDEMREEVLGKTGEDGDGNPIFVKRLSVSVIEVIYT